MLGTCQAGLGSHGSRRACSPGGPGSSTAKAKAPGMAPVCHAGPDMSHGPSNPFTTPNYKTIILDRRIVNIGKNIRTALNLNRMGCCWEKAKNIHFFHSIRKVIEVPNFDLAFQTEWER